MVAPFRAVVLLIVFLTVASQRAEASNVIALSSAARAYGFLYTSVGTEAAAHLSRPGLSMVIRAADRRYQVNDSTIYLAHAPTFANDEIYVDASFEATLAALADQYPWPDPKRNALVALVPAGPLNSPSLTISAKYIDGTQTIAVSGTGPARAPITVVIQAYLSRDIPAVTVARTTAYAGADGSYKAVLSVVSLTMQHTALQVRATAGPNATPAVATLRLDVPNPKLKSDNDTVPSN